MEGELLAHFVEPRYLSKSGGKGMFGGRELDATVLVILVLELGFVAWWQLKSTRRNPHRLVDDATRLGARARRRRV